MASSQFSKVDEYGFERPSDFNYKTYETFMSDYIKVLAVRSKKWTSFLRSDKAFQKTRQLKRYIRKGIPSEHRERVWLQVSGANKAKSQLGDDLYYRMLDSSHDEEIVEIINTDLPRTFPDNIFFNSSEEYKDKLFRVLLAYSQHNARIGYCQGMNYVAGLLLLVTKSEESSFWLLKVLIENILPDYYSPTMEGLLTDIEVISELVRIKYPDVHEHMNSVGLPWQVITTKWFICLFCQVLPTETVLRIWDCLFHEGSKILFRVCITIIGLHKSNILGSDQFVDLTERLKDIIKNENVIHCHNFMQNIFSVPGNLSMKTIDTMRLKIGSSRKEKRRKDQKVS